MKSQIDKRKDVRAKQIEERARKQQEKLEREKVCFLPFIGMDNLWLQKFEGQGPNILAIFVTKGT